MKDCKLPLKEELKNRPALRAMASEAGDDTGKFPVTDDREDSLSTIDEKEESSEGEYVYAAYANDFEDYSSQDDEEHLEESLRAMHEEVERQHELTPKRQHERRVRAPPDGDGNSPRICIKGEAQPRPVKDRKMVVTMVTVHGTEALTLWDTGSTMTAITPGFAGAGHVPCFELNPPIKLQLGTVGSRSAINYGCNAELIIDGRAVGVHYLDIVNLDTYDMVMGVDSMSALGVSIDIPNHCLRIGDTSIPCMSTEAINAIGIERRHRIVKRESKD